MIIKSATFMRGAVKPHHYPPPELPEIAFSGRSNVGKSSLINTLVNRKRLVKTSSTPGRTQEINFFNINDTLVFVDLPGYGYAKVPKTLRRSWGPMIETYLVSRQVLAGIVLILDIRRKPGLEEMNFIDWLDQHRIPRILALTKADKLSKTRQMKQRKAISDELRVDPADLILFSAKSRLGVAAMWTAIGKLIEPA